MPGWPNEKQYGSCRFADGQRLYDQYSVVGLDMESFQVGKAAQERHVPFVVVRAVSDLLEEDLPMDFNQFLTPAGWLPGAAACLRHPSSLVGLGRLRAQCTTAATRMTSFFREFAGDLATI